MSPSVQSIQADVNVWQCTVHQHDADDGFIGLI